MNEITIRLLAKRETHKMLSRIFVFLIVLFWSGAAYCIEPIPPNPNDYILALHFDVKASDFCYPDTAKFDNDGSCHPFDKNAPVYWEGHRCSLKTYRLAYFFWYGLQRNCTWVRGMPIRSHKHPNDWEFITVNFELDNDNRYRIHSVTYKQHSGWYTRNQKSNYIDVWVGKVSHGNYHCWCEQRGKHSSPNCCDGDCDYWSDFRRKGGITWVPRILVPLEKADDKIGHKIKRYDVCALGDCTGPKLRVKWGHGCWQNNANFPKDYEHPLPSWGQPLKGVYTIRQKSSGRYADASHSGKKRMVTRDYQPNDSQRWIIKPIEGYTYTIRQKSSGRYADASHSGDHRMVTRGYQTDDSQRWIIKPIERYTYTIRQKSSGHYADASHSGDHPMVTRDYQNDDSQQWIIKPD